jgi:hypothetical protein
VYDFYSLFIGADKQFFILLFLPVSVMVLQWGFIAIFLLVNYGRRSAFVQKYKALDVKSPPLDKASVLSKIKAVSVYQLVVNTSVTTIGYQLLSHLKWLDAIDLKAMPAFPKFVAITNLGIMTNQLIFFTVWRVCNYEKLHKYFTKLHGGIKHLICNMLPLIGTIFALNPEIPTVVVLCSLILMKITLHQCGLTSDQPDDIKMDDSALAEACDELEKKIEEIQNNNNNEDDTTSMLQVQEAASDAMTIDVDSEAKEENPNDGEECLISIPKQED